MTSAGNSGMSMAARDDLSNKIELQYLGHGKATPLFSEKQLRPLSFAGTCDGERLSRIPCRLALECLPFVPFSCVPFSSPPDKSYFVDRRFKQTVSRILYFGYQLAAGLSSLRLMSIAFNSWRRGSRLERIAIGIAQ